MRRSLWLTVLIITAIFSLLTSGCKKDEDNYLFTGQVIDQVTGEPVSRAIVRYGHRFLGENDHALSVMPHYASSSADGKYKLVVPKDVFDDWQRNPGPVIYAEGVNYIGSNILNAPKGGGNMDLKLYSPSSLQLHVWNDTINNQIDQTKIWITGNYSFWVYPGFIGKVVQGWYPTTQFSFKGRDIDTVLNIHSLWGNLDYTISGGGSYSQGPPYFTVIVRLMPRQVNSVDVSF